MILPAAIAKSSKHEKMSPVLMFFSDFFAGLLDILVYRGINAPPRDNKDLDDLLPDNSDENVSFLNKALNYVQKPEKGEQNITYFIPALIYIYFLYIRRGQFFDW